MNDISSKEINSKEYWDTRFNSGDWDEKDGPAQSLFFYNLAAKCFPAWFTRDINTNHLSVCDFGCAEGDGAAVLGKLFPSSDVWGLDISEAAVSLARERYPRHSFICGDIDKIENSFDVMFSSNTLEHFKNPMDVFSKITAHSKKYAVLLIPFREQDLIDEHFSSFDYSSFPLEFGDFSLVHFKELDCRAEEMENTMWNGFEILVIYQRRGTEGFKKRSLAGLEGGSFDALLDSRRQLSERNAEISAAQKAAEDLNEEIRGREEIIASLNERAEEDRNAIRQIQFEAAQHKQAALDLRKTYVWKTGVKIEKFLKATGIAFIRSLLALSDFAHSGLILTLQRGFNEGLNRTDIRKNKRKNLELCREKFLQYKRDRDCTAKIDLTGIKCVCTEGLVSIVLPVLNGEDVLPEAIDSILAQTYKKFELIIVDDGSTDGTAGIADEYARRDARIRVVHQENKKIPMALTLGFSMASGEFRTWTSADNVMLPDCLSILVKNLNRKRDAAMVYGNMRLINKNSKIKRAHFWYEKPLLSGNVCLPENADALNTYANNTIGAAFMYRASAEAILGEYSKYKYTLEDYDYWMRMNSLLKIVHTDEQEPIYLYRRHSSSLTAHDKEFGITRNRYKLMVLDDYRRDFYMAPFIWIVEGDDVSAAPFRAVLERAGHILMTRDKAMSLDLPEILPNVCYIFFGKNPDIDVLEQMKKYSASIWVSPDVPDNSEYTEELFDILITQDKSAKLRKNWIFAGSAENIFAFADSKVKNNILYELEGMTENEPSYQKKVSVIICTYMRGEKLIDALWSVLRQSFGKKQYEIIIVDNAPEKSGLKAELEPFISRFSEFGDFIRYIAVPQKGLSSARNAGMWNARGQFLLFIDDDAIADYYLIEEIFTAFKYHEEAGVIGGQIILDVPFPRPEVLLSGKESLWSQFTVPDSDYTESREQFEFPYGANFAARRSALWRVGGFRACYGRRGNDFSGGEETAVSFKMRQVGYTVGIAPSAKVLHRVDHDRFTREHVKKTICAGILTSYRFFLDLHTPLGWTEKYAKNQIKITRKEIRRFIRKGYDSVDIFYKQCYLSAYKKLLEMMQNRG